MMQELSKKKLGYTEGVLSVIINTLLFGVKIWVGTAAASVAMTADAWHTLSDTLTSLVVILGFWISGRPKDEEHPFGQEGRGHRLSGDCNAPCGSGCELFQRCRASAHCP